MFQDDGEDEVEEEDDGAGETRATRSSTRNKITKSDLFLRLIGNYIYRRQ